MKKGQIVFVVIFLLTAFAISFGQSGRLQVVAASPTATPTPQVITSATPVKTADADANKISAAGVDDADSFKKCDYTVSGETGFFSAYVTKDVGEKLAGPVAQHWIEVQGCVNRKWSAGANVWNSVSMENPRTPSGNETDGAIFAERDFAKKFSVRGELGVYKINGGEIYEARISLTKEFKISKKIDAAVTNEASAYKLSSGLDFPGGWVNKTNSADKL
jgi:hypothetical protein